MLMRLLRCLAVVLALGAAAPAVAQTSADSGVVQPDPAVRRGVLPNGLRYAILKNARPEKGASIRLQIKTGSWEEADGEEGLAHFLEHMAFNGTRRFKEDELVRRFETAGIAFGRDQNAWTSATATTYTLDLNEADDARLTLAFDWLSDVATGLTLDQAAVERERGVVLAEYEGRLGPGWDWRKRYQSFAFPELRGPRREPIGTPESIRAVSEAALRRFHTRWYRPDNAHIVIVGDIDEAAMERRVRQTFGRWRAQGPRAEPAPPGRVDLNRPLDVMASDEPQQGSGLSVCRLRPWTLDGPDTLERRTRAAQRGYALAVLNRRLSRLALGEDPPFAGASLSTGSWSREVETTCLTVSPRSDERWREGLNAAVDELRRYEAHGAHGSELDRLIASARESNKAAVASVDTRFSSSLAGGLLSSEPFRGFDPSTFVRPEESARLFELIAPQLTPRTLAAGFRELWSGSEPLISIALADAPEASEVREAWAAALAAPTPEARPDTVQDAWAYGDWGPPGVVRTRETVAEPGFTRVTFENGVVANIKSVNHSRDAISVAVRFGDGRTELAPEDYLAGQFGGSFFASGGLGKHRSVDLRDLFPDRRFGGALGMGARSFVISGSTRPRDLDIQLQYLAALLTDPGFRPDADAAFRTGVEAVYRSLDTEPAVVAGRALQEAANPDSPLRLPPKSVLLEINSRKADALLRDALTTAPLEVTLVGDVPEDEAIAALARTLGALPARRPRERARDDAWWLRWPETLTPITVHHTGARDRAYVQLLWPLFTGSPERRREARTLGILAGVLQERVREAVRETLGASYSPSVGRSIPERGDEGALVMAVETRPEDVARVRDALLRVARETVAGGVTAEAIERVRKPVLDAEPARRRTNSWWFDTIEGSAREPQLLTDELGWEAEYRSITRDEVQAAAVRWLSRDPFSVEALPKPLESAPDQATP